MQNSNTNQHQWQNKSIYEPDLYAFLWDLNSIRKIDQSLMKLRKRTFFFCFPPPDFAGFDDGGGTLSFFGACNHDSESNDSDKNEEKRRDD